MDGVGRECGGSQGPGWLSAAAGPREGLDGEGLVRAVMPLETGGMYRVRRRH